MAALIIIPFGQGSIAWFAIAALLASATLFPVGTWVQIAAPQAPRQDNTCKRSRGSLVEESHTLGNFHIVRAHLLKVFLHGEHDKLFHLFLIDKFAVDIRTSQLCLFAFMAAVAVGTVLGGHVGDKYGRKYVIWGVDSRRCAICSALPYVGFEATIILSVIIGLVISSAFSAILVYATELKPDKVGMMAGLFFGLNFGLGGIGSAFFGWLADRTSIEFVFQISTLLPLLGVITVFYPTSKALVNKPSITKQKAAFWSPSATFQLFIYENSTHCITTPNEDEGCL